MRRPAASACCVWLAAVLADLLIRHEHGISGDEPFYERMASHPGGPHNFPYAYRLGVPWLVHVLPFSHVVSFTLIAWLAIAASGAALYALLGEFRDRATDLSVPLVVGFVLSPPLLVVLIRHGRSIDPASILVMTLGHAVHRPPPEARAARRRCSSGRPSASRASS